MRTRLLFVGAALLVAACSGVLFNAGNAFPCDFSQPPGARDVVCAPGDVCGVNNVCHHFDNEGPGFEGPPTLPDFSAAAGAGTVLHPRLLDKPVLGIGMDPGGGLNLTVTSGGDDYTFVRGSLRKLNAVPATPQLLPSSLAKNLVPITGAVGQALGAGLFWAGARLQPNGELFLDAEGSSTRVVVPVGTLADGGTPRFSQLRVAQLGAARFRAQLIDDGGTAGALLPQLNGGPRTWRAQFEPYPRGADDAGVVDLAWASRPQLDSPMLLTHSEVLMMADDGGLVSALTLPVPIGDGVEGVLRSDPRSNVFAVITRGGFADGVLSTWKLVRSGLTYSLEEAWPACRPCGSATALAFTPTFKSTGVTVEVLCGTLGGGKVGVRVVGSNATDPSQRCDVEGFELPFDPSHLVSRGGTECGAAVACVQDTSAQAGVAFGGRRGEVWLGPSLSEALPLYLERVPLDVTVAEVESNPLLVALTDRYLARDEAPDANGLGVLRPLDDANLVGADLTISALLHQSGTWGLTASGDLVHVNVALSDGGSLFPGGVNLHPAEFGPRLVNGRQEPVTHALVGEAFSSADGGVRSALLAVDDSLYFVPFDFTPADSPAALGQVGPVLTPEPSTLIRSLALERTPTGSNGVDRMRGYVVTSRNVYQFLLSGSPARWTATPVFLWGGEPVETWFDQPRGGLARVGYRDGTVFTLPGGFQLVEPLPAGDGGLTSTVLDYENLGGWPVALASTGLYAARWPTTLPDGGLALPDGGLDRHFPDGGVNKPMSWFEVSLPDGTRPWLGADGHSRPGKLFVRVDPTVTVPPATAGANPTYSTTFHLLLFLDDRVLEVGRHVRSNSTMPPEQP